MHGIRRAAAALPLLFLLGCAGASAEELRWTYGGRGEDKLLEMTQAGDGYFAVGTTMSDDGDLASRTRTGEAGWALLAGGDGGRIFSYASAHKGLARMTAPTVMEDGRYALVLTDEEAQRGEWLMLDSRGRLLSRTAVSPQALGLEGEYEVLAYLPGKGIPAALTMLLVRDGAICAAALGEDGGVTMGTPFLCAAGGVAAQGDHKEIAWVSAGESGLSVTWIAGCEAVQSCGLALSGMDMPEVCDALLQDDGSVVCCGRTESGGFAARVSREGEALFCHAFDYPQRRLCHTERGYALYGHGDEAEAAAEITFLDEDGAVLDTAGNLPADALDLCIAPEGAALLTHLDGYRQKQAAITRIVQREAQPEEEAPQTYEEPAAEAYEAPAESARIAMEGGYLLCESDGFGVQVRLMDGNGREIFSTRTPIQTAADELQWRCAARLEGGFILLGGRYLAALNAEKSQQGVVALLDSQGVLRSMETIAQAGAVCGISAGISGEITLHISASSLPSLEENGEMLYHPDL